MERKLRELEIWIADLEGVTVGWGAIHNDKLEGLYIDPGYSGRGIGTKFLEMLEQLMRDRGFAAVHANASANAEQFYLRCGYERTGLPSSSDGLPITKVFA